MNNIKKPPVWFWIVSALGLLWNAMGVHGFYQQVTQAPALSKNYTPEQLEAMFGAPTWAVAAFAIAVFCGFLGCVALLLRKSWAIQLFVISLLAVIVENGYGFLMGDRLNIMGNAAIGWAVAIFGVAIFLIWFSKMAKSKGWIG